MSAAWTDSYAVEGTDYAIRDAMHPNAIGHRGADWKLSGGSLVPAFARTKVIASNLFSPILGWCLTGQLLEGQYAGWYVGWAHLRGGTRPNNDDVLAAGGQVGLVASGPLSASRSVTTAGPDYPGTAWTGPHIHMTLSQRIDGIFLGPTIDPRPAVYAALRSITGAGVGITPITSQPPIQEDDMATVSDPEWRALYDATMQIRDALGARDGLNTKAADSVLGIVRTLPRSIPTPPTPPTPAEIARAVWWEQKVERKNGDTTVQVPAIQELADAKTNILAVLANGGIDTKKLAADIAAEITPASGVTEADVEAAVGRALARVFVAAAG